MTIDQLLHCMLHTLDPGDRAELCHEGEFACASGECIPREWQCDGDNDCPGANDEANCGECVPVLHWNTTIFTHTSMHTLMENHASSIC